MAPIGLFIGAIIKRLAPKAFSSIIRSTAGKAGVREVVKNGLSAEKKTAVKKGIAKINEAKSLWNNSASSKELGLIDSVFQNGQKRESFMRFTPNAQKVLHANDPNIRALVNRAETTLSQSKKHALVDFKAQAGEFLIQTKDATSQGSEYLSLLRIGGKF